MFSTGTPIEPFFTLVKFCPYLLVFLLCKVHFFVFVTHECLGVTIRYLRGFLGLLTQTRSQVSIFCGAQYIFEGQGFWFYCTLKTNFSGRNKIWGSQKKFGDALPPNVAPWLRACPNCKLVNAFECLQTAFVFIDSHPSFFAGNTARRFELKLDLCQNQN